MPPPGLFRTTCLFRRVYFTWIENGYPPLPSE